MKTFKEYAESLGYTYNEGLEQTPPADLDTTQPLLLRNSDNVFHSETTRYNHTPDEYDVIGYHRNIRLDLNPQEAAALVFVTGSIIGHDSTLRGLTSSVWKKLGGEELVEHHFAIRRSSSNIGVIEMTVPQDDPDFLALVKAVAGASAQGKLQND